MNMIRRAFQAEVFKLRRTLFVWVIFAGALLVPVLFTAAMVDVWPVDDPRMELINGYRSMREFWAGLFLPLLIILQMGLLANVENQNGQWKHLFALPIPRYAVFIAKWLVAALAVTTSAAIYSVGHLLSQIVLNVFLLGSGPFDLAVPWQSLLVDTVYAALAVFLIVTIHLWFSLETKSLVTNFGVGIVAIIFNLGLIWGRGPIHLYPWTLASNVFLLWHGSLMQTLLLSILGGLAVGVVGCRVFTRQDVM